MTSSRAHGSRHRHENDRRTDTDEQQAGSPNDHDADAHRERTDAQRKIRGRVGREQAVYGRQGRQRGRSSQAQIGDGPGRQSFDPGCQHRQRAGRVGNAPHQDRQRNQAETHGRPAAADGSGISGSPDLSLAAAGTANPKNGPITAPATNPTDAPAATPTGTATATAPRAATTSRRPETIPSESPAIAAGKATSRPSRRVSTAPPAR